MKKFITFTIVLCSLISTARLVHAAQIESIGKYLINESTKQCAYVKTGICSKYMYEVSDGWKYPDPMTYDLLRCPSGFEVVSLSYQVKPDWRMAWILPSCIFHPLAGDTYTLNYFWFRIILPLGCLGMLFWFVWYKRRRSKL